MWGAATFLPSAAGAPASSSRAPWATAPLLPLAGATAPPSSDRTTGGTLTGPEPSSATMIEIHAALSSSFEPLLCWVNVGGVGQATASFVSHDFNCGTCTLPRVGDRCLADYIHTERQDAEGVGGFIRLHLRGVHLCQ